MKILLLSFCMLVITSFSIAQSRTLCTPVLDSVSVASPVNGHVYIGWHPCDSAMVAGYYIYRRQSNGLWPKIATVLAPATSYLDTSAAANFHPESYRIAVYDEANNVSDTTPVNLYQNTIYVFPYLDSINNHVALRLQWNKYINWPDEVKEYQIYININNTIWDSLSSVNGNTFEFYHQNIMDSTLYCYFIRAVSNSGHTSTSIQTCVYTNLPGGIEETKNNESNISVYPNPALDEICVELLTKSKYSNNNCHYSVFGIDGKKVLEGRLQNTKSSISIGNLENGLYFIEVRIGKDKFNDKFIIAK
jgi:hypothetical protein